MSMVLFAVLFPEIAVAETRSITVQVGKFPGPSGLPSDEYGLLELYCTEPRCDCRRVMFNVVSRAQNRQLATINHAFELPAKDAAVPEQTFLDPLNVQSEWSNKLLDMVVKYILTDQKYSRRLERHYSMFKEVVNNPKHPQFYKIRPYIDILESEYGKVISETASWRVRQRIRERQRKRRN